MATPDKARSLTDAELAKLERRVARVYQKARDDLQKTVDDYFERFRERDAKMKGLIGTVQNGRIWTANDYKQWRLNQIARGKRFEALRDKMAERYANANETAMSYVNDATPGIYSLNRNYSAYVIDKATGGALTLGPDGQTLNADFILYDERTVRRLIVEEPDVMPYYPPERAVQRGIDLAYGKSQITKNVVSGILQGLGVKQMSDALQERVQTMERNSAIRAVRTSVTAAQNAGRMDSYHAAQEMGINLKKRWLSTLDGRTRHSHRRLDGETRDTDDAFSNGCMYPGDPRGAPHETYNCRCTLIASLPDFDLSPGQRRARGATADAEDKSSVVIEDMTYSEWAGWVKKALANERNRRSNANTGDTSQNSSMAVNGAISSIVTFQRDKRSTEAVKLGQYKENNLYSSREIELSPAEIQKFNQRVTSAKRLMGVSATCKIPFVIVTNDEFSATGMIAAYNPELDAIFLSIDLLDDDKCIVQQAQCACPENPLSTLVHELYHWQDAAEYRKMFPKRRSSGEEYRQYQRKRCFKALTDAGIDMENGECFGQISQYAYQSMLDNDWEEVYTEYRTQSLLGK